MRFVFPAIIWSSIVIFLSLLPGNAFPQSEFFFPGLDKIVHVTMYTIMTHLWITGFKKQNQNKTLRKNAFYIALLLSFSIGLILEITQHFYIQNRNFEVFDLIANGIGCIFGAAMFKIIFKNSYN